MRILSFILITLILNVNSGYIFAQQKKIDSLVNELKLLSQKPPSYTRDTIQVELLNDIAFRMGNFMDKLDTAMSYAEQALSISEKIGWSKGKVEAYGNKGKVLKNKNKHEEAIAYYLKAADIAKAKSEKGWTASSLYSVGQIYYDQSDYSMALTYFLQALRLNEETNNQTRIANNLTFIGKVYAEIEDFENSLNYHHQALKIFEQLNNKIWASINLGDIAAIYRNEKKFGKAIDYYNRVLNLMKGNVYSTYNLFNELGHVYNEQSNAIPANQPDTAWPKAMDYYSRALKTANELQDGYAASTALNGIGWLHLKKNNIKDADVALNKALELLLKEKDPQGLRNCYYSLSKLDSVKGNWKSSLSYFKMYAAIDDSLFNKKKSHELARLQIKHETDKKQEEITILNKDNDLKSLRIEQQQKNILLIIAGAIILLLAAGGFIYYRNKKIKQEALKQISEAKLSSLKSLMDKHFIFSSLHSIDTFLMNNDSEAASDYLVKYSKLIRSILEMSNQAEVSLEEEISLCRSYLDLERIRLDNSFDYDFSIDGTISMQETLFPSMLLQPLVENAVKHGVGSLREEGRQGSIHIDIKREKDKLICSVTDNGKGLQFSGNTSSSHRSYSGKGIIERVRVYNTLRKNKASFLLKDNNPGVTAVLTLPYLLQKQSVAV